MGNVLDSIRKQRILEGPVAVNSDFESDYVDIDGIEGDFSIQFDYSGGSSVNMELELEVSNDRTSWVPVTDSQQVITDNSGTHVYDVAGSGVSFIRLAVNVTAGSINIDQIEFVGRRRH